MYARMARDQRSHDAHIELHKKFEAVIDGLLPSDKRLQEAHLWHWDLHASNIFVDGHRITSILDWQNIWAGPLFLQARVPGLFRYDDELMLYLPENFKDMETGEEKDLIRQKVEKSIVLHTYYEQNRERNPKLRDTFLLPHLEMIQHTISFAEDTWGRDIIPFRQCLIRIAR